MLVILHLLLVALPATGHAGTEWPVSAFEVYEGRPGSARQNPLRALANAVVDDVDPDTPVRASVPLTPALKRAIEVYLGEAARRLQDMDFTPARMEPVRTRADGQRVFRVYYMDFSDTGYARVSYQCEAPFRITMQINAARLTDTESPGVISEKGYVDLAHELFHAVQRNSPFFKTNCEPPNWITEGQAEAVGQDLAWQLRQVRREKGQVARWGLRRYHDPLAVVPSPTADEQAYQTSSFWRYLAERAHARANADPSRRLPGPGIDKPHYGVDYHYLARFLGDSRSISGRHGALMFLNRRLLTEPAFGLPLAGIYPHFAATLADYGRHRVIGESARAVRHDAWISNTLGECWEGAGSSDTSGFKLDLANPSVSARRVLEPVAARCVRVNIGAIPAAATLDVRANVASPEIGAQLYLGVAGGQRVAAALVGTRPGGAGSVVSWTLAVNPGETLDLVIANVAKIPNDSARADLTLELALPGWQLQGDATAPTPAVPSPAGRQPARQRAPGAQQTQGATTASAERNEDVPLRGCGWPAEDFNGYCGPKLVISLRAVPGSVATAETVSTTGGFMNQMLATMERQLGADGTGARMPSAAELDGLSIRISLPLPAYGQTPSHDRAEIKVDGADWPTSGAYGPTDLLPGAQTYFAPSGRVTIEKYTPLELRGRFEAALVALPLPLASKESLPSLPVIKVLRGSFVVTRPFEGEPGFAYAPIDLGSLGTDMADRQPGPPATSQPDRPDRPGPGSGPGSRQSSASGCDCSCAGYRAAMELLEALDKPDAGLPGAAPMAAAMCMVSCGSAYRRCAEE